MIYLRIAMFVFVATVSVAQTCQFTVSGTTMTLQKDCTATGSITIPNGFTLNGNNHLINVPESGRAAFAAGFITNGGPGG